MRWNNIGITVAGVAGNPNSTNDRLNMPIDILLDWANNLYIADGFNNRIQKYMLNSLAGQTIAGNGTGGLSSSQFNIPTYISLDDNENLYITDTNNYRIQYWPKGVTSGTTIAGVSGM